ncbi:GNAT family N-acetyltransferase [Mycolicibacterium aubagnense]|uniref:N-acetyltransferase domain-containing protein n=1 Tax=Mycolicibacterium aubagnense TaxID=319707 RepID=A0ABN5YMG2_9MYCO|nr:GNAT family N-acetyltransferase [Mycolicibacterium aubagnense]TLH61249.1 N-acetyltransferase [Mycolicibacterium aubagnense]WGI35119.1 GNAT family N-acetyltransferase [Mycolicibacterium aubagnense]BBX82937.1 hypothetical protein MAUB_08100 [Mycolicibacterium aubagnense]
MKIEHTPVGYLPPATFSAPAWQCRETPWSGEKITVRDLEPDDFPAVMALAGNLGGDGLYLRFFTYGAMYLAAWEHSVTEYVPGNVSLGAFDGNDLVAVGKYVATGEFGAGEISIVVAHRNHRGIATVLLRRLGDYARSAGTQRLVADVLPQNRAVRRVIADAGWPCIQRRDDEMLTVEVDLTASLSATCAVR